MGKRVDNGGWVEGSLVNNVFFHVDTKGAIPYIINPYEYEEYDCMEDIGELAVEVISETVGQFTGLLDKHGRKIFEGDIVVTCPSPLSISDGGNISKRLVVNLWVFTDICLTAMCEKSSKRAKFYKIVGNIHDNKMEDLK